MNNRIPLSLVLFGISMWAYIGSLVSVQAQNNIKSNDLFVTMKTKGPLRMSGIQVPVIPHVTYVISTPIIITTGSGEFGFYVDEYDANGEWISGQWKGSFHRSTDQVFKFSYAPSNENVAYAATQYYLSEGSTLNVHIGLTDMAFK